MDKLAKAKDIINRFYDSARCGIFNTRNVVGDPMDIIFNEDGLKIMICYNYSYFEVFGLTADEFLELEKFYEEKTKEGGEEEC